MLQLHAHWVDAGRKAFDLGTLNARAYCGSYKKTYAARVWRCRCGEQWQRRCAHEKALERLKDWRKKCREPKELKQGKDVKMKAEEEKEKETSKAEEGEEEEELHEPVSRAKKRREGKDLVKLPKAECEVVSANLLRPTFPITQLKRKFNHLFNGKLDVYRAALISLRVCTSGTQVKMDGKLRAVHVCMLACCAGTL